MQVNSIFGTVIFYISLLVFSLPGFAVRACIQYQNAYIQGGDLGNAVPIQTEELCCTTCTNTSQCQAYVWTPSNDGGTCQLKSTTEPMLLATGTKVGINVAFTTCNGIRLGRSYCSPTWLIILIAFFILVIIICIIISCCCFTKQDSNKRNDKPAEDRTPKAKKTVYPVTQESTNYVLIDSRAPVEQTGNVVLLRNARPQRDNVHYEMEPYDTSFRVASAKKQPPIMEVMETPSTSSSFNGKGKELAEYLK